MTGAGVVIVLAAARAATPAVMGTIPAYPGATRPLKALESQGRVLALTSDKPEVVAAYYIHGLAALGWQASEDVPSELEIARAGQPAWLTFTKPGDGRVDIIVSSGKHPRTGKPVTLITYSRTFKP